MNTLECVSAKATIPQLWGASLRRDTGRPFLTFYDDATGERIELSHTSMDNWVSKTANLLVEELDCQPGDLLAIELPPHWQAIVFLLAAWSADLTAERGVVRDAAVQIVGPNHTDGGWDAEVEVVACSLRPLGGRFPTPLEQGVLDFALVVPGQSDYFAAVAPPAPSSRAVQFADTAQTHAELLGAEAGLADSARVLTDLDPTSPDGLRLLVDVLKSGSSLVLVRNLDPTTLADKVEQERVTVTRLADRRRP